MPRSRTRVSRPVLALLAGALLAQLTLRAASGPPEVRPSTLHPPPSRLSLRAAAAGDPAALARGLMLWLQALDHRGGASVPLERLDYRALAAWLDRILSLEPGSGYPLRSAVLVYASVAPEEKQRAMLDFVYAKFLEDPEHRWRWLAFAALHARHRLADRALALKYALAITGRATGPQVPAWARDMSLMMLRDLGRHRAAAALAQRPLASGRVGTPHELRHLEGEVVRGSRPNRLR